MLVIRFLSVFGSCFGEVKMMGEKNDDESNLVIRLFGVLSH